MPQAKVDNIAGNLRYKVVSIENSEFYLMDIQPSLLLIVCPFLNPLFRKRYYKISKTSYNDLKKISSKSNMRVGLLVGIGILVSGIFRLFPIDYFNVGNPVVKYGMFSITLLLASYLRWKYSRTPENIRIIVFRESEERFKLNYVDFKFLIVYLFIIIFGVLLYIILKQIFVVREVNLILCLILFFIYLGYLFTSLMFYSVGNYTIKS